MGKIRRCALLFLTLVFPLLEVHADDGTGSQTGAANSSGTSGGSPTSALPKEAPSSLFDAKLGTSGDDDAQLLVSGSWQSTLLSSVTFQSTYGSSLALTTSQPFLFTQAPSLGLSFLLFKKYFVEAAVSNDVTQAKYSAGYKGGDDELLRELRVGNDKISFPSLPFLNFGAGSYRSFGAAATIGSGNFIGKAMVRYDEAEEVTKTFVGSTELTDTQLTASSFVSGKFFLTLYAPGSAVTVYVESSSGTLSGSDGNQYRQLSAEEYSYSASTGFITLSTAATTRVLAAYSGSGSAADPATGKTLVVVTVGGQACDLLYDPPDSNHTSATIDPKLQVLNRYASTATASSAVTFVKNLAENKEDGSFSVNLDTSGYAVVTRSDQGDLASASALYRSYYRQPFAASDHGLMPWIYTTDFASSANTTYAPSYTRCVVVRGFSSSATISIDADFVAGSVTVTRDGIPSYSFSVDNATGVVTLSPPPSSSESIVITYMRQSADRQAGLVVGALGGFWDFGDGSNAWTALGGNWSIPGTSYSSGGTSSVGSIALSSGYGKTKGAFTASAALAGRYTDNDATNYYRIEGMESSTSFTSTFRPLDDNTGTYFTVAETAESSLASAFPSLVSSLHADGSTQKAMEITAGPTVSNATPTPSPDKASYYKVESSFDYDSYGTFSFYAILPKDATLQVRLDDGSATPTTNLSVTVPANTADSSRGSAWRRYILHYGKGDSTVYCQTSQGGAESALDTSGNPAVLPSVSSSGYRLVISVSGLSANEVAWVDEVNLTDATGAGALMLQAQSGYADKDFSLGEKTAFLSLQGLDSSAYVNGALDASPYASSGGSVKSTITVCGFNLAQLGINAAVQANDALPTYSGGHTLVLPAANSPVQLTDSFNYAPDTGAFGRSDTISLSALPITSLSATQSSAWTPPSSSLSTGMLLQTWSGSLALGPSWLTLGLNGKNRSWPGSGVSPGNAGSGYASAWIGAYSFLAPNYESYSDLREIDSTLSAKTTDGKEFLSASFGETATPEASSTGIRDDSAAARLSLPLAFGTLSLAPYYQRSWKGEYDSGTSGMIDDELAAFGDFQSMSILYTGIPVEEFFDSALLSNFSSQTGGSANPQTTASYNPEIGLTLSRDFGSYWYDLMLPSALSMGFGRVLTRSVDTVTDDYECSVNAKISSVNLFGKLGSYPIIGFFDSDEYLTTLQATYDLPRDGEASTLNLLYHGLGTLHMGDSNTFDMETKATVAQLPASLSWSSSLKMDLSMLVPDHWALSAFKSLLSLAITPQEAGKATASSIVSQYLEDISGRKAVFRRTLSVTGGWSGYQSDAVSYQNGYAFQESYEGKLTVPERLTLTLTGTADQDLVASTQVLTLDFQLSLSVTISF